MLRSNSKKAIGNLGAWLLKTETGWEKDPTTAEEAAEIIAGFFNDYLGDENSNLHRYELRRLGNYQAIFTDWLAGLPCRIGDAIYLESATDIIGDILEETKEERAKYSESEAEAKLCALVWIHYVSKAYYKIAFGW